MIPTIAGELNETHAFLRESPRHEALLAEALGLAFVDPVKIEDALGLALRIEDFWHRGLHLKRELIGLDDTFEFGISRLPLFNEPTV
jgi:hypothetical protein